MWEGMFLAKTAPVGATIGRPIEHTLNDNEKLKLHTMFYLDSHNFIVIIFNLPP